MNFNVRFLLLALVLGAPAAAYALAPRSFVSSHGLDTNTCTLAAPCRTLAVALAATSPGGEIVVLDSAGYGTGLTIAQSVHVTAPAGVTAQLLSGSGTAITVNGTGIDVSLEGLSINASGGANGIAFLGGNSLSLDRVTITYGANGIAHNAPGGRMSVANSVLRGSDTCYIAQVATPSTPAIATITGTRAEGCYFGFVAQANSFVTISSAVSAGNQVDISSGTAGTCYGGFVALGDATGTGTLVADGVVATGCYGGVLSGPLASGGNGAAIVSNSLITRNYVGIGLYGSSTGSTFSNNRIFGNTVNQNGAFGPLTPQ